MKNYGFTSVAEFLDDRIVYRNLNPVDPRLPKLADFDAQLGLPHGLIPRKSEADYAQAVAFLLDRARQFDAPGVKLQRLVFIGDTHLLDATAFDNLCQAGGWRGVAFIGSEDTLPPKLEKRPSAKANQLILSNRWSALYDLTDFFVATDFAIDDATAVVVDMDKTAIAARGRNGHAIDQARLQAVEDTVAGLLGTSYDQAVFLHAYHQLNQPEFHSFTADNQDYLAYICLMLGGGLFELERLVASIRDGGMTTFRQFIDSIEQRKQELTKGLAAIHSDIYVNVRAGDPTPFKAFRRNEYLTTTRRMGCLEELAEVEKLLAEEIVITQELRRAALDWREQGALLFGLSDKPDEASLPTNELAAQGYLPLHRAATHAVGE